MTRVKHPFHQNGKINPKEWVLRFHAGTRPYVLLTVFNHTSFPITHKARLRLLKAGLPSWLLTGQYWIDRSQSRFLLRVVARYYNEITLLYFHI